MPKVKIIRKGARHPVTVPAQMARHLTKTRNWSYVDEVPKISKPKRAAESKHEGRGDETVETSSDNTKEENPQTKPETVKAAPWVNIPPGSTTTPTGPMKSDYVKVQPTKKAASAREQLNAMTKADLKALGQKLGVELKGSESKDQWVDRLNRYMRRDMRAER